MPPIAEESDVRLPIEFVVTVASRELHLEAGDERRCTKVCNLSTIVWGASR